MGSTVVLGFVPMTVIVSKSFPSPQSSKFAGVVLIQGATLLPKRPAANTIPLIFIFASPTLLVDHPMVTEHKPVVGSTTQVAGVAVSFPDGAFVTLTPTTLTVSNKTP